MFFAFFISASFCQVTEGLMSLKLVTKRSKWQRVWPLASLSNLFFREKTGSGNSGKNPDTKFQTVEVRFGKITTKCTLSCRIFKVSFLFSLILTFLSKLFLSLYGWFFWINQLICNSWVIWVHKSKWSQKFFL